MDQWKKKRQTIHRHKYANVMFAFQSFRLRFGFGCMFVYTKLSFSLLMRNTYKENERERNEKATRSRVKRWDNYSFIFYGEIECYFIFNVKRIYLVARFFHREIKLDVILVVTTFAEIYGAIPSWDHSPQMKGCFCKPLSYEIWSHLMRKVISERNIIKKSRLL